jgi:hypothetical protein
MDKTSTYVCKMMVIHFFCPFCLNIYYIYDRNCKTGVFMKKKERKNLLPPTDGSIKLSKAALWSLKYPNGIGVIHDMRAVMK